MTTKNKAKAGDNVSLSFYGPITDKCFAEQKCFDEGSVAKSFEDIDPNASIDIALNSVGGDVSAALAICGILSRHKGNITIRVDGLAASAATLITSVKNAKTVMSKGSLMMIHNPMSAVAGNKQDMEKEIDVLDKCAESMRAVYADKTGLSDQEIMDIMDNETWLSAQEAVDLGFADEVDNSKQVAACLKPNHILAIGGCEWDLKDLPEPPKEILMVKKEPAAAETQKPAVAVDKKEPLTASALKAQAPELLASIVAETQKAERDRIKALYDIDTGVNHDMVVKAMFEEPRTAEEVAIATLKAQKEHASVEAKSLLDDGRELAETLADAGVKSEGALPEDAVKAERDAVVQAVHEQLKILSGRK